MFKNCNEIQVRLSQKTADGRYLMAARGDEPVEELREIAETVLYFCPAAHSCSGCPFAKLATLTDQSIHAALLHMSRKDLLDLLEMERDCRAQALEKTGSLANSLFNPHQTKAPQPAESG